MPDARPWVKSYDEGVDPDLPIPPISFAELLEEGFATYADRFALHFMGTSLTFAELDDASKRIARYLCDVGCEPGDVVGISLPNTPQYLIALAGAFRAGCVTTGVSPLLSGKEMAYQLKDSGAKVFIALDAIFEHKYAPVHEQTPTVTHVIATSLADYLPRVKGILAKALKKIPMGVVGPLPGKTVVQFREVLRSAPPEKPDVTREPADLAVIQYTGGTTGAPKGAELTNEAIVMNSLQCMAWFHRTPGEGTFCSAFPYFHIAGAAIGLMAASQGITQVIIADPRNTKHLCGEIARYRPSILFNVPSLYHLLMNEPAFLKLDFSCVEACISGASPFAPDEIRKLQEIVGGDKVVELYGMTETCGAMTSNPMRGEKRLGAVGLPMPNMRVKIVDLETGQTEAPLGEEGEIICCSRQNKIAYFNKPEETANTLREFEGEKWLYTGDIGHMDEDGYVHIVDRKKDMIIVSGYKVFSSECEEKLHEHPAVEYCAFIGIPNPERPGSEIVKVYIQLTESHKNDDLDSLEKDIVAYAKSHMAPYKVPKVIEFIDEMPLTSVGKLDKKALR